jgi:hypothetical protein
MPSAAVPGFLPSTCGLRFRNAWPHGPTLTLPFLPPTVGLGNAALGLCGGMVMTTRDLFEAGIAPPPDTSPPAHGSPRFRAIVRRQVQSLDWLRVPLRYYDLQAFRPDPPGSLAGMLRREPARIVAATEEWPRIRAAIDAGELPIVGLVRVSGWSPLRLARNHQTLGYAYEASEGTVALRVYDPNHPGRDDVVVSMTVAPPDGRPLRERVTLAQSTGEPLLGFFRQPYPRPGSLRAWR